MGPRIVLLSVVAVFMCVSSHSQQKTSSLEFKSAEVKNNGVTFEPVFPVDWEQVARANFHRFDIDHPDRAQIREHFFEPGSDASFEYEAALLPPPQPLFYYLLADSGAAPLVPDKLVGVIAYVTDKSASRVEAPTFMGQMSARPAASRKIDDAGFVVVSHRALTFTLYPVEFVQDENLPGISRHEVNEKAVAYFYGDREGSRVPLGEHDPKFPGVKKAYLLSISGELDKYLVVSWNPDIHCSDGCCEHSYTLIRLGKTAENVAGNAYGCDV